MPDQFQKGYEKKVNLEKETARIQDLVAIEFEKEILPLLERKILAVLKSEPLMLDANKSTKEIVSLLKMFMDSQTVEEAISENMDEKPEEEKNVFGMPKPEEKPNV